METAEERKVRLRTGADLARIAVQRGFSTRMLAMKTGYPEAKIIKMVRSGDARLDLGARRTMCAAMGVWDDERE